ncbi:MAG TPA: hypothetical protein ENO00_00245 [Deltaproteobacteria bacterium]|nr:hypothetical protein [Deltaproteobacteria bacterium]
MKDKERLNALEVALNNEQREREFYLKHAKRTNNPLGKAMFQQIADEELEHYERLKELHAKWDKKESWPETVPLKVNETIIKDILKDVVDKVDKMPPGDKDDLEAIRTAIDFEAEGAIYYARMRDKVTNQKEKDFFNLLADMEHEHFVSLKDTEELLSDPEAWYQKTEKPHLDGG